MDFDVSQWQELARTDPEDFERRRAALIEHVIASAPRDIQCRLRGVQFRVDMERRRASNPLSATVRISRLMWESYSQLRESLDQLASSDFVTPKAPVKRTAASIVPLRHPSAK